MIIFFNQNKDQVFTVNQLNTSAGAEYAIKLINSTYNLSETLNERRNFAYFVENQFPNWLIKDVEENSSYKIIDFVQELYNWIYSPEGLDLYPNFENLQNAFYTNEDSLRKIYSSIFTDFDFEDFTDLTSLREFLISNKKKFIEKKGTQNSIQYFLETFFGSQLNDYTIEYGVNDVFVLNSSNTNEDTLSNGSSLQEYSIRLEVDIDEKYQDDLINLIKPMGFNFDLVKAENSIYSGSVTGTDKVEPYEIVVS